MNIFAVGRDGHYNAKGLYKDGSVTVLKGSKLAPNEGKKIYPKAKKIRADRSLVSEDMVLLQDVTFRSLSTAANLVTGNISNGMRVWKDANKKALGDIIKNG